MWGVGGVRGEEEEKLKRYIPSYPVILLFHITNSSVEGVRIIQLANPASIWFAKKKAQKCFANWAVHLKLYICL